MTSTSPLGVFDSGIGGLTVAHAIKNTLPNEDIVYFGDTQHLPYGEKSASAIINFSKKITSFLLKKQCKAIIIACNSASSIAYKEIQSIAKVPVFNVIDPVINRIPLNEKKRIGVIGTKATIESNVYYSKIKKNNPRQKVYSLATPLLAPMIEEEFINEDISRTIIKNYLSSSKLKNIDYLILACTHYPLIKSEINEFYQGKIKLIDSSHAVSLDISNYLNKKAMLNQKRGSKYEFYVSNYTRSFEESAKFFFKREIKLKEINLI